MTKKPALLLVLAISTGLLAACGGDDDKEKKADSTAKTTATTSTAPRTTTSTESAEAPTKAEYIAEFDAICTASRKNAREAAEKVGGDTQGKPTVEQYQEIAAELAPLVRESGEKLRALPRPEGDEAELDRYFEVVFKRVELADEAAKDPKAAEKYFSGDKTAGGEATKLARAYGLKCGSRRG